MKTGKIIFDKYEILKCIGSGGSSNVYLVLDSHLNKQWAIKEINKKNIFIKTALKEANLLKKLDHPSLARIVDILEDDRSLYIVMDYIEGQNLEFYLKEYGIPSQDNVIDWAKQLCDVFIYLHNLDPPIIYRDMKPSNVILQPNGRIKIIDFGIAKEYFQNTMDTMALGTIGYAAPEQYKRIHSTSDPRTDIYCLGATLHHLLTGIHPGNCYEFIPIRQINSSYSCGLENIIIKCTQPNPDDRYSSCEELLYAFNNYEKEDSDYQRKIQRDHLIWIILMTTCVFFFSLFLYFHFNRLSNEQFQYDSYLLKASQQDDISLYFKAIQFSPTQKEGYIQLIEYYKSHFFSYQEYQQFLDEITTPLFTLQKKDKEGYGDICFEIGKLCWYYFDYEKDDDTLDVEAMEKASKWFKEACTYCNDEKQVATSNLYYSLGTFFQDVSKKRNEATSINGMYSTYFEQLYSLFEQMEGEDDLVQLETSNLIVDSLEMYIRDFAKDGISKQEVVNLYESVLHSISQIDAQTEKSKILKERIETRDEQRKEIFNNGYIEGK